MEIRLVRAELFHVDERTDTRKLIVAFRNFAIAHHHNIPAVKKFHHFVICFSFYTTLAAYLFVIFWRTVDDLTTGTITFTSRCLHLPCNVIQFFLQREIFRTKVVEKIKTHFLYSITFFPKIVPFMR